MSFPVQKITLVDALCDEIIDRIRSGKYLVGQKLPPENELMKEFSVSRPVLREALRSLATLNVISTRAGQGSFVQDVTDHPLLHVGVLSLFAEDEGMADFVEARRVLEIEIAALVAERADADDVGRLQTCLAKIKACVSQGRRADDASLQFHLDLARSAHNKLLLQMMHPILVAMRWNMTMRAQAGEPSPSSDYEWHHELLEAILTRDADTARQAMRHHIALAEATYNKMPDERVDRPKA